MLNTPISDFLNEERNYFESVARSFRKIDKFNRLLAELENSYDKIDKCSDYDPCKYIRGGKVIGLVKENKSDVKKISKSNIPKEESPDKKRHRKNSSDNDFPCEDFETQRRQTKSGNKDYINNIKSSSNVTTGNLNKTQKNQNFSQPVNEGFNNKFNNPYEIINQTQKVSLEESKIRNQYLQNNQPYRNTINNPNFNYTNKVQSGNQFTSGFNESAFPNNHFGHINHNNNNIGLQNKVDPFDEIFVSDSKLFSQPTPDTMDFRGRSQTSNINYGNTNKYDFNMNKTIYIGENPNNKNNSNNNPQNYDFNSVTNSFCNYPPKQQVNFQNNINSDIKGFSNANTSQFYSSNTNFDYNNANSNLVQNSHLRGSYANKSTINPSRFPQNQQGNTDDLFKDLY